MGWPLLENLASYYCERTPKRNKENLFCHGAMGLITESWNMYFHIGWLVGMLLVSSSGLVEEDAIELFHYYGFHFSSSSLM